MRGANFSLGPICAKVLVHTYQKTTEAPSSHSFIGQARNQMGEKCQYLAKTTKNAYFWPNLAVFGPKILISKGGIKRFGTHIIENPTRHLVRIVFWSGMGPNGSYQSIFNNISDSQGKAMVGPGRRKNLAKLLNNRQNIPLLSTFR